MDTSFFGKDGFIWWKGVVEDRNDPIFLGRVRVRIFGWHTENKIELPTEDLPWAMPSLPIDNGRNSVGLKEGDWCWGFFLDGQEAQYPVVVGFMPGIDESKSNPTVGFYDPTPDELLVPTEVPRPPDMSPIVDEEAAINLAEDVEQEKKPTGKFRDPTKLPGQNVAFGQLTLDYDARFYKFDINKDGNYNNEDANLMRDVDQDGVPDNEKDPVFFTGVVQKTAAFPISRYPLENRLMEPSTSRLARNEKIEETIVGLKRGDVASGESAGYEGAGVGGDAAAPAEAFQEPETPYDAKYPYNHVYESESGHVIEVDDTPGVERLHWYHRSGTFKEIHPDGQQVNKVVKSEYNFIYKDFFNSTAGNISMDAGETFKVKSGQVMTLNAGGDLNHQIGGNINNLIGANINTRVAENTHTVIEKESWTHVSGGTYLYVKEGVLHVMAEKDVLIQSVKGSIQLTASDKISLCAPSIFLQDDGGGQSDIHLNCKGALRATRILGVLGSPPNPSPASMIDNEADKSDWYTDGPTDASAKYGFLFANGAVGDVYKPVSDSDKKLVIVSPDGGIGNNVELLEALPTGELEAVRIVYQHPDGTKTEWEVVRPKHIPGDVIEVSGTPPVRPTVLFEDGVRFLYRFSKGGGEYPKQMFWRVIGQSDQQARFVVDSAERHQSLTGPFDEKINFDLKTTKK